MLKIRHYTKPQNVGGNANEKQDMKKIILPFLILISLFAYSQPNKQIEIDTIEVNYDIEKIVKLNSFVPQIKSGINSVAQERINADIKKHYEYTSFNDSSSVKKLQDIYELDSIHDFELEEPDGISEHFTIEYFSNNILNLSIFSEIFPYRGRPGYFFKSLFYDLNTGEKLDFSDFFSVPTDTLTNIFNSEGYFIEWNDNEMKPIKEQISEWLYLDEMCPHFYFNNIDNELHLMVKTTCWGPIPATFAIPLTKLIPYVEHYEIKNWLKLWGKDVHSLIGCYRPLGSEVIFNDYAIQYLGGFLLSTDGDDSFGIEQYLSSDKRFLMLFTGKHLIRDVLEIDKKELENRTLTEYCITKNGLETEIIALVNPTETEFHTKIVKAWRANRDTGKFEKVNKRKIKKCINHSYGL